MRRFLLLWMCLGACVAVVTVLVSVLVFHRVDLRYQAFLEVLLIPTFQAAIVAWLTATRGLGGILRVIRDTVDHPVVLVVLLANATLLVVGWAAPLEPHVGIAGAGRVHLGWAGLETLAAALIALATAGRGAGRGARVWLCLGAASLLVAGSSAFSPWVSGLETLAPVRLPTVLKWALVYGAVAGVVIALVLGLGGVLERWSRAAGFWVDAAVATAFLAALVVASSFFLHPYLLEPWASVVRTGASLAGTFVLVGAGLGWSTARGTVPARASNTH